MYESIVTRRQHSINIVSILFMQRVKVDWMIKLVHELPHHADNIRTSHE
jgi:hypothetical protein